MRAVVVWGLWPAMAMAFTPSLSSQGVPLRWSAAQVTLSMDGDDGTLAAACGAWSQLPEARVELGVGKSGNLVHFEHDQWTFGNEKLAVTLLDVDPDSGEILRARVEVNEVGYHIASDGLPTSYDLGAVLTHELGHVLGLAHSTDDQATMFAATPPSDTHQRHPDADDRAGIAYLYDGVTTNFNHPAGCSLVSRAPGAHDGVALCVLVLLAATLRWRERQGGTRDGVMAMTKIPDQTRDRHDWRAFS